MSSSIRSVIVLACMIIVGPVLGQGYPTRPVRIIVPFAPGGVADVAARLTGQKLSDVWGQQVIIENRPGAAGIIGIESASKAAPDGYTLLMATNGEFAMNPHLYAKLPYRPIEDFVPISIVMDTPFILAANAAGSISSIRELIAAAKPKPGQVPYSSAGNGGIGHVIGEWFAAEAGIKLLHVPYKGGAPAAAAIVSGEVPVGMVAVSPALPFLKSGKIKVLGVTSAKRVAFAPDWPTVAESGVPGFNATIWAGVFAPAGTPRPVIDKISADIMRAMRSPDIQQRLAAIGGEAVGTTPEETLARIKQDSARFSKVIQQANIRLE